MKEKKCCFMKKGPSLFHPKSVAAEQLKNYAQPPVD